MAAMGQVDLLIALKFIGNTANALRAAEADSTTKFQGLETTKVAHAKKLLVDMDLLISIDDHICLTHLLFEQREFWEAEQRFFSQIYDQHLRRKSAVSEYHDFLNLCNKCPFTVGSK